MLQVNRLNIKYNLSYMRDVILKMLPRFGLLENAYLSSKKTESIYFFFKHSNISSLVIFFIL